MIQQLQNKHQLSILLVLSIVSVFGISPFIVIRFIENNIIAALINLTLVTGILTLTGFAHLTGKHRLASAIIALFINIGVASVIILNGVNSVLWVYPVIAVTFFLVNPLKALLITLVNVGVIATIPQLFNSIPLGSYLVSSLMLAVCAFVYATYANKQLDLLATLNSTDPLTGALNRRALNLDAAAAIAHAERSGSCYLLAFLDLDFFKKVNDEFGHAEGDKVLKQLVTTTKAHIRKYDKLYRFGGEEFVLIIPEIAPSEQVGFINKLRETIKNELKTPAGKAVTVSFGVASWIPGTTVASWFKRADDALYQAKEQGRDRAVFSEE
ncbi:GGDEF domain-containing protein [Pseudoalteromonas sp.]|uniref:GGDEF domain-containing protein n=1 Tax=Pseudoalteromonas sp. TaxID=53249 RepID=UPI0035625C02